MKARIYLASSLLLCILGLTAWTQTSRKTHAPAPWEYSFARVDSSGLGIKALNADSHDGWEAVAMSPDPDDPRLVLVLLKRLK